MDPDAMRAEQRRIAERVRIEDDLPEPVGTIAAFDAAYEGDTAVGALVLADRDGTVEEAVTARVDVEVPYVPGLLAYREMPVLDALWERADRDVGLLLVDGGGTIHPRRCGSASHAGVRYGVSSIGVTKSLLLGEVDGDLDEPGDVAPVRDGGELVGCAFRSCPRAKHPIYVSPGHRVSAETALDRVRKLCSGRQKLPDVLWRAHKAAGRAKDDL